jgi:hypothetical protein
MKTLLLGILLFFGLNLNASNDVNNTQQCHMEGVYKVCGNNRKELLLDYEHANHDFWGQSIDQQLVVLSRQPIDAPGPGWEEYFIVDYKNMMVYDEDCFNGFLAATEDDHIIYQDSDGFHIFKKEDFDHCKQPLKEWLKKPYEPYK